MDLNRIHNMPCADMFAGLEEQAALIIADPPYGIGYKTSWKESSKSSFSTHRKEGRTIQPRRLIEHFGDSTIDTSWMRPAFKALEEGGAMYLFTRWDVCHHWYKAARKAGFKVVQRIVWDKAIWGAGDLRYFGSQTEDILFCVKGNHELRWGKRGGNLWYVPKGFKAYGSHTTQKPIDLIRRIITYSSDVGDLVLDPFTGSGAACIAAQRLHRRFVGCDISPTFAAAAQQWLEDDARQNAQVRMMPMF